MPVLELNARVDRERIQAIARTLVDQTLQTLAPEMETGRAERGAAALPWIYLKGNYSVHCVQIASELQGGTDLMQLFHPGARINVWRGEFTPAQTHQIYQTLTEASRMPEFFRWQGSAPPSALELADDPGPAHVRGISAAQLAGKLKPVVDFLGSLPSERIVTLSPDQIYGELAWKIAANLLGTLRANLCRYHSGMNFVGALTALCTDLERGEALTAGSAALACGYGRQLLLSLQTGNA